MCYYIASCYPLRSPTVYRTVSRGRFRIGPFVPFQVSDTPQVEYPGYRVPYFNRGQHVLSLIQPAAPDSKPSSSLAIQKMEKPLACGQAVSITIRYAIVGETVPKGSVDVLYLVSRTRNNLQTHGASEMAPYFLVALLLTRIISDVAPATLSKEGCSYTANQPR